MAPQLIKMSCKRCEKSYFTYEEDKDFCTQTCEGKYKYCQNFNVKDQPLKKKSCLVCGENSGGRNFCNIKCKRIHEKKPIDHKANFLKEKKKRNLLPYEVLNKIAERKRVFDDDYFLYRKNHERI